MDTKKHKKDVELVARYLKELAVHGVGTVAMESALNDYKEKDLREKLVRQSFEMELAERVKELKAQAVPVEEQEPEIKVEIKPEFIPKDWPSVIDKTTMVAVPAYILQNWQLERSRLILPPVTTVRELFAILVHSIRKHVKRWHMMWQYWR